MDPVHSLSPSRCDAVRAVYTMNMYNRATNPTPDEQTMVGEERTTAIDRREFFLAFRRAGLLLTRSDSEVF